MNTKKDILEWYLEAGVTETIGLLPLNRFNLPQERVLLKKEIHADSPILTPPAPPPDNLLSDALNRASRAQNEEELQKLLNDFEGCSLKKTAKNTIFGEGVSHPEVLFVGEAPGADEDRTGRPFVGVSGKLLDKMMSAVGLSREKNSYITNIIPWRPPGNRSPSTAEVSLCLPFIQRHIELLAPKILVFVGGVAFNALLSRPETITRARGNWYSYQTTGLAAPIPAIAIFHPAFLLRSPGQKKLAWRDMLTIAEKLNELKK